MTPDDDTTTDGALALLAADHAEVRELFDAYEALIAESADPAERRALAAQICQLLTVHATVEEEIFYPAARSAIGEDDLVDEAEAEHASARDLVEQLQAMDPGDDRYDSTVFVLAETVEQHVQEEEEELFPRLRTPAVDLQALAERISARKEELLAALDDEA